MKTNYLKLLVAVLALTGLSAYAQNHQPRDPAQMVQHRVSFLTNKLGLSPAQQEQATSIFTNEMSTGTALRGQMKTAHQNLSAAVQKGDNAGIDQASGTIGNLTSQMISAHSKAEAAFVQTLNPDQQKTYSEMHKGGWGMRGFHRHGGPGGPSGSGGPGGPPQF
ncbi:MAG TPA: periplasmic heavy metal sensor [Candidatus Angelobacter sp.]